MRYGTDSDAARRRYSALLLLLLVVSGGHSGARETEISGGTEVIVPAPVPKDEELEDGGAVVGNIVLEKRNIFDLSDPKENKWLYRWANRLHVVTRDQVIRNQILFEDGDAFSGRLLEETERIVRAYDPCISCAVHLLEV